MAKKSPALKVSERMQEIAQMLDSVLEEVAGERVRFVMVAFPPPHPQFTANMASTAEVVEALDEFREALAKGQDLPPERDK